MSDVKYPVRIETKRGAIETGWGDNQRACDVLLVGFFTEQIADALIQLNRLYEAHKPISELKFQLKLLSNMLKELKGNLRWQKDEYKHQRRQHKERKKNA